MVFPPISLIADKPNLTFTTLRLTLSFQGLRPKTCWDPLIPVSSHVQSIACCGPDLQDSVWTWPYLTTSCHHSLRATVTSCQCNWSGRPLRPTLSWLDCSHSCSPSVCSQESSQLFYLNINQSFRFSSQSPAVASCLTPDENQSPSNSSQGMVMSRPAPLTPSFSTALPSFRLQCRRCGCDPWKISWRRKWQPAPVFLPGESHGQRSLAGFPWVGEPIGFQGVRQDSVTKQQSSLNVPSTSQVYSFLGAFALSGCSFQMFFYFSFCMISLSS